MSPTCTSSSMTRSHTAKPMENIVANGVTTIDLSAENIVIEGPKLKTGYLLHSAALTGLRRPTAARRLTRGLISTDNGKTGTVERPWGHSVISIVLHEEADVRESVDR